MYRIITVSREYGSGGAAIAAALASELGWTLFDRAFITAVARAAHVDPALARNYDERLDSWIHRVSKNALWRGAFEQVAVADESVFFDAETMAALTAETIKQAAGMGNCVIVGRGAQCLLQSRSDAFHVFVYAPLQQRIERLRTRVTGRTPLEELALATDKSRAEYIRAHFGCDWKDLHLYHLMVNSGLGERRVVSLILHAAGLGESKPVSVHNH
jgi:cytidylate kinase